MARQHEIGDKGESLARSFLIQKGYEIIETNWRYSRAEIDIIAKQQDILVFIEVKTRSSVHFGLPEDFVDAKKQKLISAAANAYMIKTNHEWLIRFDIISIVLNQEKNPKILHIQDAFFAGL